MGFLLYKADLKNLQDLKAVIMEECVLTTVNNILFIKKEEIEVKSVTSQVDLSVMKEYYISKRMW